MNGFIVVNKYNLALGLGEDRVLWAGCTDFSATVFSTHQEARNAIKRTLRYAARWGYPTGENDPWGGQWIVPVKGE